MKQSQKHRLLPVVVAALAAMGATTSCILDHDFRECPNDYFGAFRYDMNLHATDAFPLEVGSVSVYGFDAATGALAFTASEAGSALQTEGFKLRCDVAPGTYDVVVWGGMEGNSSFTPLPAVPAAISDLTTAIATDGESRAPLTPTYHAQGQVTFTDNNLIGSFEPQTARFSLVKNVKRVNVHLVRLDGAELSEKDFTLKITANNAVHAHDNSVSGAVVYSPWAIKIVDDYQDLGRAATVAQPRAHSSEVSFGRLMASARSRLEVWRNSDGARIISLPLEPNVLLYRDEFFATMPEQEYLDRLDSADLAFVLTEDNSWQANSIIYINKWATLPVQEVDW